MAYDEFLAERVKKVFDQKKVLVEEKKMMGGLCYMVNDKMCIGVDNSQLMVRIDPADYEESLTRKGCVPMDFTGRPMKGFVFVQPEGIDQEQDLEHWVQLALDFNPKAKASKKRIKKKSSWFRVFIPGGRIESTIQQIIN